ncbi:ATP-binding protein [Neobacillus sp.]|uniref:ATP-binding protein n=1 Tax=Neobacillus sp. TaxID=2675273 RepID=UPI0028A1B8A3|nr:ATP-binding protein [Neobacillus sp.]
MFNKIIQWLHAQPMRIKVLVFGLIMSTLPLLLISSYYYYHVKMDLKERILDKQELMLDNLSGEIELEFNQMFQRVQMFASLTEQEKEKGVFYELLQQNESIEEAVITNEKGYVEKRVSRYRLNLPDENEQWFSEDMWSAFQLKERIYGKVEFNQFGQPVMKLAIPYLENGKRKAVGATIQLQKIIGKISSLRQDHFSYLYLLDRNGKVIAHQDNSKLHQNKLVDDNHDVLGVRTEIKDLGWTMVMEQSKSTAYAPINEMVRNGLMVVAIVTLIVSIISIYAGIYFTAPIVLLDKGMKNLKAGCQAAPIKLNRDDEFGKLSQSFNEMSKELQEKTQRLKQEKERLNVIVNGIGAGLALVTKDYKVTWMNPVLENWFNKDEVELPCYTLIGGTSRPCENCPITCPGLTGSADMIMRMKNKQNVERLFRHRVFPLNHAIEGEGEYLVMIEDITEQKEMEEKIIQTDKLSALGLMASGFAHEVNNPLATINVYAEDLIDRLEQNDKDLDKVEMAYYLSKIKENTERCKRITGNLLNFSRKSNWTLSQINIKETIQSSIGLVEHLLKKKGIIFLASIEEELPILIGDSLKLMQVLVNLINNAIDAVENEGKINISAKKDKDSVMFSVSDNGCGIPKKALPRLFDPFYTTKPVGKGTGLGLSVCYGIVEEFGGSIHLESNEGSGTTVQVSIPAEKRVREETPYNLSEKES